MIAWLKKLLLKPKDESGDAINVAVKDSGTAAGGEARIGDWHVTEWPMNMTQEDFIRRFGFPNRILKEGSKARLWQCCRCSIRKGSDDANAIAIPVPAPCECGCIAFKALLR